MTNGKIYTKNAKTKRHTKTKKRKTNKNIQKNKNEKTHKKQNPFLSTLEISNCGFFESRDSVIQTRRNRIYPILFL